MLTDKKLARIEKILGPDTIDRINLSLQEELVQAIADASGTIKVAEDELEANPKYQEIKESMKAIREGLTDVKKRQNAIIQYCLHLLEEKTQ